MELRVALLLPERPAQLKFLQKNRVVLFCHKQAAERCFHENVLLFLKIPFFWCIYRITVAITVLLRAGENKTLNQTLFFE